MAKAARKPRKKLGRGKQFATGIDIGTFSVKIVSLGTDDAGTVVISKITVVKLEAGEKIETQEKLLQRQKNALKEALKKHGAMPGKIIISFPRSLATARYINFPSSNRDEIKEMLLFDVERHVPFSVDDLEISYQKIELVSEHETRILMVCVPKKEIMPFVAMCYEAGVSMDVLDLDVHGDFAAYSKSYRQGEVLGIVNFGRSTVNFTVMQNNKMIFSRSIPVSESQLLGHFIGAKSWRDLQGRVTIMGPLNPNDKKHYDAWVEHLGTEMKRCITAFQSDHGGRRIDRLVYCGGAGFFPAGAPKGLTKFVTVTPMIEPPLFGDIPHSPDYHGTELSTAIGLALRGIRHTPDDLNLIPKAYQEEELQKQKTAFRKNIGIFLFMIITLLGGAGYLNWHLKYSQYSKLNDFSKQRLKETNEMKVMRKKIETVQVYLDKENSCVNVLKDAMVIFQNEKCYINKITFTKRKSLEITGQALLQTTVDNINKGLNKFIVSDDNPKGYYSFVSPKSSANQLPLDSISLPVVDFTFSCFLKTEELKTNSSTQSGK